VIPPDLIVGPAVRGSEINELVSSVALDPKSDANKSAGGGKCTGGRLATSMTPSRKDTSLTNAYDVPFAASGLAITWIAFRPL
jgi:hypothetical protein